MPWPPVEPPEQPVTGRDVLITVALGLVFLAVLFVLGLLG